MSGHTEDQKKQTLQIRTLLEEQNDACVKINYQVHHLDISHMKPKPNENITDYMSWLYE